MRAACRPDAESMALFVGQSMASEGHQKPEGKLIHRRQMETGMRPRQQAMEMVKPAMMALKGHLPDTSVHIQTYAASHIRHMKTLQAAGTKACSSPFMLCIGEEPHLETYGSEGVNFADS